MAYKISAYGKKLQDPRWQKKRLEILTRDNWACQQCFDSTSMLHVHHRWYGEGEPWDCGNEALVTLCASCHESETNQFPLAQRQLIAALKRRGALSNHVDDFVYALTYTPFEIMNEVDWSIVTFAVRRLLVDHYNGREGSWAEASEAYDSWCAAKVAKK